MASKFARFKGQFPEFKLDEKENSTQRIIATRRDLEGLSIQEVEEKLLSIREERSVLEERLKANYEEKTALEMFMSDWFEQENYTSHVNRDGFTFRVQPEPYCTVEDASLFDAWAHDAGWDGLYTVNHQTLNASVKALMLENQPAPPGVGVYMKNKVIVTKPR